MTRAWSSWLWLVFALLLTLLRGAAPAAAGHLAGAPTGTHAAASPAGATQRPSVAHAHASWSSQVYFAEGYTGQRGQVRFAETLSILNTTAVTATGQIEYFLSGGITNTVAITIPARSQLAEDVARDVGANQQVSALVEADQSIDATRTISRTTTTGGALAASVSRGEGALSQYWYFAEGYTGATFQEYMALLNPGNAPTTVTLAPYQTSGSMPAASITRTVAPHSRVTVNVRAALPDQSLGLLVQADRPIAAERVLYWGAGSGSAKFGTAVSTGITGPASQWIFPYASVAGSDQSFVAIINPSSVEAHVHLTFYGQSGTSNSSLDTTVEPGVRTTIALRPSTAPPGGVFAIVAGSDVPVVCEQAQYFGGSPNAGGHAGTMLQGTGQAMTNWSFLGFDTASLASERLYVLNTDMAEARLTATFLASATHARFRALPDRLTSIDLAGIRGLQHGSASTWTSDSPVVVALVARGVQPADSTIVSDAVQLR